jgi:heme/copper-type cytochrome/quinol oxidase subunit 4
VNDRDFTVELIVAVTVCAVAAALLAAYKAAPVVTVFVGALVLLLVGVLLFLRFRREDSSVSNRQVILAVGVVLVVALGAAGFLWLAYCSCWD